ncbi:Triosephosphate isomerase [Pleurostoma richardsiae]|uniref:Triosephosphate isomerase n=1 Tax=Pleurostoma richardsiae TaxID=41990 RepID=A0AA38VQ45_9PEZI|nr:Triosephosphate isomerase [Pleurostoma richardsiae]
MSLTPRSARRIIGVSTKLYFSAEKTRTYVSDVLRRLSNAPTLLDQVDIFIVPDPITMVSVIEQIRDAKLPVLPGSQDTFHEDTGAYTGEISPTVLAEVGCRVVEVGHAERRRLFGETDAVVALKAAAVVKNGMVPLVCIGERTPGLVKIAVDECRQQVEAVIAAVPAVADILLAYEPVWAIGAAEPAGSDHVLDVVSAIKQLPCVQGRSGTTRVLYGGSAGPGLFEQLKTQVDGLFMARFAHDPERFLKTVQEVANA